MCQVVSSNNVGYVSSYVEESLGLNSSVQRWGVEGTSRMPSTLLASPLLLPWGHVIHHVNTDESMIFHILFFFSGLIEPNIMLTFNVSKDCASCLKYILEVFIKMFVSLIFHKYIPNSTILKDSKTRHLLVDGKIYIC